MSGTSGGPDVATLCSDLIRFDTSNPGRAERPAAEYVAERLTDLGLAPRIWESEPGRSNVVVRMAGRDPSAPAMLVHGHLDTVPAVAREWRFPPTSGEVHEGAIWGRGAVDMKNAVAMYLAALGRLAASGNRPERDIVFAFVADEETGGQVGARFLVHEHADLFEGCRVAIGEVGGFNVSSVDGTPVFTVSVADKGLRWYDLWRAGTAGHGSMLPADNPIVGLAEVIDRLSTTADEPIVLEPMRMLAEAIAGRPVRDGDDVREIVQTRSGRLRPMLAAALRNTINVTRLEAGFKDNVIPATAWARLDCRFLPGHEDDLHDALTAMLPERTSVECVRRSPATPPDHDSEWFTHLADAVRTVRPDARVAPYVFSGGTDNKWFTELGVATFGFTPLLLPADFDFPGMFHGVDERVPVAALEFGVDVLTALFRR